MFKKIIYLKKLISSNDKISLNDQKKKEKKILILQKKNNFFKRKFFTFPEKLAIFKAHYIRCI